MGQAVPDDDLPSGEAVPAEDLPEAVSSVTPTWLNAAKGVGEAALAVGAGGLKAITSAANDILPGTAGRAAVAKEIATDPILNYQGGPEAKPILDTLSNVTRPIAKIGSAIHQGISDIASPRIADVAADVATLAPGTRGTFSKLEPATTIESGHPLSAPAEAESARLSGFKSRGEQLGLDLPESGTEARYAEAAMNNRPVVNAAIRSELQLPKNAPLSPQMLEAARNQYTAPAYQAVRDIPKIPLPKDYLGDIEGFESIPEKYRPPVSGSISGEQAVDMSRYLRNKANKYFAAAKGNPEYEDIGQTHWDAAQAVEDAVKSHLEASGSGDLAKNWDAARVYAAKTYSVQNALDGAGNVRVPALKAQLIKGKPLSGDLETLANLGAQNPEALRTTRITMPKAGPLRRAAAYTLPVATSAAGAFVGGAPGAAAGDIVGKSLANRVLNQP